LAINTGCKSKLQQEGEKYIQIKAAFHIAFLNQ
jgi:hypothetical protein